MEIVENKVKLPLFDPLADVDVDAELRKFEEEQVTALGLDAGREHWRDVVPREFTSDQRSHTTILCGGLTMAHDLFVEASLKGLGYHIHHLD